MSRIDPAGHESLAEIQISVGLSVTGATLAVPQFRNALGHFLADLVTLGVISFNNLTAAVISQSSAGVAAIDQERERVETQSRRGRILYHYTGREGAVGILATGVIFASEAKDFGGFTFPAGAYATDIPPWDASYTQRELSALFYGGRANRDVSWFVAFKDLGFSELIRPGFPHQHIYYALPRQPVPVEIIETGPNLMAP